MSSSLAPTTALRPISSLRPNPLNPRGDVDASGLDELAASIGSQGVLQPLLITPEGVVVAGHRRLAAARLAGLQDEPAVIRDLDPMQQQEIMLVENLQRKDLSPVEEARAYQRLLDAGHTLAQLARRVGAPSARITARLALLRLDERVQWMFHRGDLPLTLAPVLLKVADPVRQRQIATIGTRRQLTVPEMQRIVERGAGALQSAPPKNCQSATRPQGGNSSPRRRQF
jgi:ParB family chromosome partitioning protein